MLYKNHLAAMLKQETLLKNIAAEKERLIHRLTEENKRLHARVDRMELRLLPPLPVPKDKTEQKPAFEPGEGSWQAFLNHEISEIEKEQNGISNEGREAVVHQSGSSAETRSYVGTITTGKP